MNDNTVSVDRSQNPVKATFAPVFNTAVPLVDRHVAEGRGDKIFLYTEDGETVTFAQLAERVNRCGNLLKSLDIGAKERMLMAVKDCPAFYYLFWGAVKAGIIPVPLNTLMRTADFQYMIEDSGCALVAYSPEFAEEIEPAIAAAANRPAALRTEGADGILARLAGASPDLDAAPTAPDDDCYWLYSSGSTGRPKGTVHRQRDIIANAVHYSDGILRMTGDDLCFSAAKLFFAYGFGNSMTLPLWAGAATVLSERRPTPEMTFEIIERFRPTIYFGVPTLFAAQLKALESMSPDLSSLRLCVSAGEALPADLFRRWQERTGGIILDGIGSTECTHIFISNRIDDYKPGSSGRIVAGYEARILDENDNEVPDGEVGRLLIRGESIAPYYWNQPEKTAETMKGDWIETGDTYIRDADGWYTYCGRSDDMIKVGGIWCSPIEIEARLIEHPKVLEAAIVGRPDDDGLIKPEAHVILNDASDAGDALAGELLEYCKDGLARYKYPRWFHFVDALPKTATGKIQRFKLRST